MGFWLEPMSVQFQIEPPINKICYRHLNTKKTSPAASETLAAVQFDDRPSQAIALANRVGRYIFAYPWPGSQSCTRHLG
jgi:bifunctional DNase/RNase